MRKLSIENKIENLNKIAKFIEEFGDEKSLDVKVIFELNLILDELITNTISYGYKDERTHLIEISVRKNDDIIVLGIIDDGEEFNPLKNEEVNLETPLQEKRIGGLGIHLIKKKADDISYERKNGKNILSITKRLNSEN